MERMSNDLNRVVRFTNWRDPIEEAYFPKLDNMVANRVWPPRPANSRLSVIFKLYSPLFIRDIKLYTYIIHTKHDKTYFFCVFYRISAEK